jgi:hypothetical protein
LEGLIQFWYKNNDDSNNDMAAIVGEDEVCSYCVGLDALWEKTEDIEE